MYIPPGLMQSSTASGHQIFDKSQKTMEAVTEDTEPVQTEINEAEVQEYILACLSRKILNRCRLK